MRCQFSSGYRCNMPIADHGLCKRHLKEVTDEIAIEDKALEEQKYKAEAEALRVARERIKTLVDEAYERNRWGGFRVPPHPSCSLHCCARSMYFANCTVKTD